VTHAAPVGGLDDGLGDGLGDGLDGGVDGGVVDTLGAGLDELGDGSCGGAEEPEELEEPSEGLGDGSPARRWWRRWPRWPWAFRFPWPPSNEARCVWLDKPDVLAKFTVFGAWLPVTTYAPNAAASRRPSMTDSGMSFPDLL
jgi:hypothetical protein